MGRAFLLGQEFKNYSQASRMDIWLAKIFGGLIGFGLFNHLGLRSKGLLFNAKG
jgi:hypothetical protein